MAEFDFVPVDENPFAGQPDPWGIQPVPGAIPGGHGQPARVLVQPGRPIAVPAQDVFGPPELPPDTREQPHFTQPDIYSPPSGLPEDARISAGQNPLDFSIAPNITSLSRGEPRAPIPELPEYGKIPSAEDPRIPHAAVEFSGMLPVPGGEPGLGATALAKVGSMFARRGAREMPGWIGASAIPMRDVPFGDFYSAISKTKADHPFSASVTLYDPQEYAGMKTFSSPAGDAGYAIKDGDDIVSVHRHPDSPLRNSAAQMLSHAVQNGGRRLDAYDTELTRIYGNSGFRAVARIPFDERFAPPDWSYEAFKEFNGGRPDVVFMVHDPYSPGYKAGDGQMVGSYDEAVAIQKREADAVSARKQASADKFNALSQNITGLKGIGQYLTPQELDLVTKRNAQSLVDVFSQLPSSEEMAAVAYSGRAKKGWYKQSAKALVDIFGAADAPRFTALLAALSPQTGVEDNAINALRVWNEWVKSGRPTKASDIVSVMGRSVQGDKGEGSILGAWKGNAIRALQSEDPSKLQISGPKVNSFMLNLRNHVNEVTNDAWMANYSNISQGLFASNRVKDPNPIEGYEPKIGIKSPGYMAMSGAVRKAAQVLSEKTGELWTPAEIQETVWSWAKTLYEKVGSKNMDTTAKKLIKAAGLSHEEIGNTPDFALLFANGIYRKILEEGGYGPAIERVAASSGRGRPAPSGTPVSAEGSGFTQSAFQKHLQRAAERLDKRRANPPPD